MNYITIQEAAPLRIAQILSASHDRVVIVLQPQCYPKIRSGKGDEMYRRPLKNGDTFKLSDVDCVVDDWVNEHGGRFQDPVSVNIQYTVACYKNAAQHDLGKIANDYLSSQQPFSLAS